ncbi:hypothetical protein [Actinoplanes sp. NPDC020271]|uniref:hypothetical protein n=1 Tax=Actinoplanes sp. NPDC020271 TaxID=3363896 RepID=UPI0037B0C6F3
MVSKKKSSNLLVLGFMLVLTVILRPSVIHDGGWRAWVATGASFFVVGLFVTELSTPLRRRRPSESAHDEQD